MGSLAKALSAIALLGGAAFFVWLFIQLLKALAQNLPGLG